MIAQLAPGPNLKQLFKCADAAGQCHKGIAALGHHGFALMHVLDDVQFVASLVGQFLVHQRLGNDADDAAARLTGGFSNSAHQAGAPAAIDQLAAALANPLAYSLGNFCELRVGAGA